MINKFIPLPKALHTVHGRFHEQPKISFNLSRNSYSVNNMKYDINWNEHKHHTFEGYKAYIMNKSIMITLFFTKDVLRTA